MKRKPPPWWWRPRRDLLQLYYRWRYGWRGPTYRTAGGRFYRAITRTTTALGRDLAGVLDKSLIAKRWLDPRAVPTTPPYRRPAPKVGRNTPCPCGSGRKHKRCCWRDGC